MTKPVTRIVTAMVRRTLPIPIAAPAPAAVAACLPAIEPSLSSGYVGRSSDTCAMTESGSERVLFPISFRAETLN